MESKQELRDRIAKLEMELREMKSYDVNSLKTKLKDAEDSRDAAYDQLNKIEDIIWGLIGDRVHECIYKTVHKYYESCNRDR